MGLSSLLAILLQYIPQPPWSRCGHVPMLSQRKVSRRDVHKFPGRAQKFHQQVLLITLPSGRWWPGSGKARPQDGRKVPEWRKLCPIDLNIYPELLYGGEKNKPLFCWAFRYLSLFVTAAPSVLPNTCKNSAPAMHCGRTFLNALNWHYP